MAEVLFLAAFIVQCFRNVLWQVESFQTGRPLPRRLNLLTSSRPVIDHTTMKLSTHATNLELN